jgi:spermidine dehydrogenase
MSKSKSRCAAPITRRDFVNGVLAGSGAALLSPAVIAAGKPGGAADLSPSGSAWTGYGGVGDYRWSNGNTEAVRNAAHGIRDHRYPSGDDLAIEESFDIIVVGGGFSGVTAAYEFHRSHKRGQTCLLLENHPVIGGEAKQNEFEVGGERLLAPQGSNGGLVVTDRYREGSYGAGRYDTYAEIYRELNLPGHYELEPLAGGAERYNISNDHYDPMVLSLEKRFATGYYFRGHGWSRDPTAQQFRNTPWRPEVQREMDDFANNRRDVVSGMADADRWLDSVSYHDVLDKLGYGADVKRIIDPYIGVANFGVCGNAISGYAAKRLSLPGTFSSREHSRFEDVEVVSFPGGNAAILRAMVMRMMPDAIGGGGSLTGMVHGPLRSDAFDRRGRAVRIRLAVTATRVQHDGAPGEAGSVIVTYARDGHLHRVRAKAVVMAAGGWVNRNVVADLGDAHREAYGQFRYGPILTANVAVRNWRFFDRLGITAARWFEGLGWHVCVRRNVLLPGQHRPLTPDSPVVLTFYIPFLHPEADPAVQGSLGRAELLATSYAEFEGRLRAVMSELFAGAGFDEHRDIAGIVLNRWGHSYFAPPIGFFFGIQGRPPPSEVIHRPHGRVVFAHSELQGNMNMAHAMLEGRRGARTALGFT